SPALSSLTKRDTKTSDTTCLMVSTKSSKKPHEDGKGKTMYTRTNKRFDTLAAGIGMALLLVAPAHAQNGATDMSSGLPARKPVSTTLFPMQDIQTGKPISPYAAMLLPDGRWVQ